MPSILTVAVACATSSQNGPPIPGARFRAKLNQTEKYQGFIVPSEVTGIADANGLCILNLWPNALGVAGSLYEITATHPTTGNVFLRTTAFVPASSCNLHEILVEAPFPPLDASQQALQAAQGALAPVTAQAAIATSASAAATASAAQANAKAIEANTLAVQGQTSAAAAVNNAVSAANSANEADQKRQQAIAAADLATRKAAEAQQHAQAAIAAIASAGQGGTPETSAIVALATQQAQAATAAASAAQTASATANQNKLDAAAAATDAGAAAALAENKASAAATAAQTATTKAGEITAAATTVTTKLGEVNTAAALVNTQAAAVNTAKTAADTAKTGAETAKTGAETAKTAAETAKTAAETAKAAAETARNGAQNAIAGIDAAVTAAATAKTAAEQARDASLTNKQATDTAKAAAETARTEALTAKTDAETARTAAIAAKTAAEAAAANAGSTAAPAKDEIVLTYGAGGNVAWNAGNGTVASIVMTQNTTIGFPTGFTGSAPVDLTLIADENGTGGYSIDFAPGYFVKKQTIIAPNTRAIYRLLRRGATVTGGVIAEGIPLVAPVPLAAPGSLTANNPTSVTMQLAWLAVPNAAKYDVYRNGVKVNAVVVTGLTFTDTGLQAGVQYAWTVRAIDAAGIEGPFSNVATRTTEAAPTSNAIMPMPAKVNGMYFEAYEWPHSYTLLNLPPEVNVVYLFNAQPMGAPDANGARRVVYNAQGTRDDVGDGWFDMLNIGEAPISNDKIATIRARGVRVILTVGGQNAGFNFNTHARAVMFVASFKAMVTRLGGIIDGLDWNTFEAYLREVYKNNPAACATNTSEMVWISQQLKDFYGPNFSITMPPAPSAFPLGTQPAFAPYDIVIAQALKAGNALTIVSPQYYDTSFHKEAGGPSGWHAKWCDALGANMICMGLSHGNRFGNFDDCMTTAESIREVDTVMARDPGTRGFYTWSLHDKVNATFQAYMDAMVSRFGASAPVVTPAPVGNEAAVTSAFAYSGGQNGARFTAAPAYLRSGIAAGSAVLTAAGQTFARMTDRSANDNSVYSTVTPIQSGDYAESGGKGIAKCYHGFQSTTGGGSGEATANGFTLCVAASPKSYYTYLWDDRTGPFNGRALYYDSDENGYVFSVGTGSARVNCIVRNIGTLYQTPVNARHHVKAWHDRAANTISLSVNGGAAMSANVPTFAPGGNNFTISGQNATQGIDCVSDIYESIHVFSALTQALRDDLGIYVAGRLPA